MGCLCAKPVPPPAAHSNLVGTWANNANAAALRTGYGRYRHKYGFIMGIDAQTGDEELCVRLKIDAVGFVSYAHVPARARGPLTLIDMPVTAWGGDGSLVLACGAPPLSVTGDAASGSIEVNGVALTRQQVGCRSLTIK